MRAAVIRLLFPLALLAGGVANARAAGELFELVGVHPEAAAQSTALGRMLVTLFGWRGQLYAGYGDFGANTGPISVTAWDPATGAFRSHWVSCTEAIYSYRVVADRLYAAGIDPAYLPRCSPGADYAVGEPWSDRALVGATHVFDIATLTGADLWLIGSQQVDAVAWRSLDGGATWAEAQRVAPRPGQASGFARFYFAGAFGGRLYLHAVDTEGPRSTSLVFDGARWTDGANLLPGASAVGWRPVVFAGRLVYQSPMPIAKAGAQLLAFDGQRASVPLATPISPRGLRCRPGLLQQKCCLGAFRVDDDRPEQSSARPP